MFNMVVYACQILVTHPPQERQRLFAWGCFIEIALFLQELCGYLVEYSACIVDIAVFTRNEEHVKGC
jgi:hypothetical protein